LTHPLGPVNISYLDFLAFFLSFVAFLLLGFISMQPQPQGFFLVAIFITSFLWNVGMDSAPYQKDWT
jgi:hypothetical membrane protein